MASRKSIAEKKSTEAQAVVPKRSRPRSKPTAEVQPIALERQPASPARPSPPWMIPAAIAVVVALLGWLLVGNLRPLDLAAAQERLARFEALMNSDTSSAQRLSADLVSAKKSTRLCEEGLQSMVRMWNRYVQELKAADSGTRAAYHAAKGRFEAARKQASLAVDRCQGN
jgi:hypothetical protein